MYLTRQELIKEKDGDVWNKEYVTYEEKSMTPMSLGDLKAHQVFREKVLEDNLPSKVDAVGYVEPNKRIKQMIEAGWRIDAYNKAVYDYENEIEEDDGYRMAAERNDWDDLDMLSAAELEKQSYFENAYRMYRRGIEMSQRQDLEQSEVKKEVHVGKENVENTST